MFVVYDDGSGGEFFRRREVADELGRPFSNNPASWRKYYRYGVAKVPERLTDKARRDVSFCPRPATGKVEPFLTLDGLFRAVAATRSGFGTRRRNQFLKAQKESDLKRLAKEAVKLIAEQGKRPERDGPAG